MKTATAAWKAYKANDRIYGTNKGIFYCYLYSIHMLHHRCLQLPFVFAHLSLNIKLLFVHPIIWIVCMHVCIGVQEKNTMLCIIKCIVWCVQSLVNYFKILLAGHQGWRVDPDLVDSKPDFSPGALGQAPLWPEAIPLIWVAKPDDCMGQWSQGAGDSGIEEKPESLARCRQGHAEARVTVTIIVRF